MTETEAIRLFKCLSDKSRLQILKSLAQEDMYVERLAERLGLTPPTVSFHLKKLADAGAVTSYKSQYYRMYALNRRSSRPASWISWGRNPTRPRSRPSGTRSTAGKILDAFLEYGKLKSIPAQRKKARILLEEIVKVFDYDRIYSEREVNLRIADFTTTSAPSAGT